jgi:hypothetical protein
MYLKLNKRKEKKRKRKGKGKGGERDIPKKKNQFVLIYCKYLDSTLDLDS